MDISFSCTASGADIHVSFFCFLSRFGLIFDTTRCRYIQWKKPQTAGDGPGPYRLLKAKSYCMLSAGQTKLLSRNLNQIRSKKQIIEVKKEKSETQVKQINSQAHTLVFSVWVLLFGLNEQLAEEEKRWEGEVKSEVLGGRENVAELYLGPGPERTAAAPGGQPPPQTACSSSSAPPAQQRMKGAARRRRAQLDLRTAARQPRSSLGVPQDRYAARMWAPVLHYLPHANL